MGLTDAHSTYVMHVWCSLLLAKPHVHTLRYICSHMRATYEVPNPSYEHPCTRVLILPTHWECVGKVVRADLSGMPYQPAASLNLGIVCVGGGGGQESLVCSNMREAAWMMHD